MAHDGWLDARMVHASVGVGGVRVSAVFVEKFAKIIAKENEDAEVHT